MISWPDALVVITFLIVVGAVSIKSIIRFIRRR